MDDPARWLRQGNQRLGRSVCRASQISSKGELTGKLERPAGICPCDDSYARCANRRVRIRKVRGVQDVGGIQPYLNIRLLSQLAHLPVFGGADVQLPPRGSEQDVSAGIPIGSERGLDKVRGVEPVGDSWVSEVAASDAIR